MTADNHEGTGVDALMAAITGEQLPPEARGDAALRSEYRSAVADVALLREQLAVIAEALDEPVPAPKRAPVRAPRRRRRAFSLAVGALAVACAATVFSGVAWLAAQSGGIGDGSSDSDAKSASDSAAGQNALQDAACARLVVEGTVTAVRQLPADPGLERVTLRVIRSYKPAEGKDEITVLRDETTAPVVRRGDHVLVVGTRSAVAPDTWFVGDKEVSGERELVTRALAESSGITCE
ncbi:hypothetical protein ACIO93_22150 [Streptomyces sp. NPDC087903]|uniref:hypothetical protein n=1 Tax=Streptomyces sp. NPDC087903 TaxID=3365819 RepID=UPI00381C4DCB